jgi:hypothetical protein
MFHPESSPIPTFKGFEVKVFRQGKANLIERTLQRPFVLFASFLGRVGVFLPRGAWAVEEALLDAAWRAQGSPQVHLPTAHEVVLFGEIVPIQAIPTKPCDLAIPHRQMSYECWGLLLRCCTLTTMTPSQINTSHYLPEQ